MGSEYKVYVASEDPYKGHEVIKAKPFKFANGKPAYLPGKDGDIMLLKPEEKDDVALHPLTFRDPTKDLEQGEPLLSFGAPKGLPNTVTIAYAGLNREISVNGGPLQLYAQIDGQSDLGDSGGPITDSYGDLVAFVSLTFPGKKVSFGVNLIAVQHWMLENGIDTTRSDEEKAAIKRWIDSLGAENPEDGKKMMIKLNFAPANSD